MRTPEYFVVISLLILVLATAFMRRVPRPPPEESFQNFIPFKPTLYWFVDAEPNARAWWDFGARNSVTPNRGYLEVAQKACERTQGGDFTIVPLIGRDATLAALPDAPPAAKQLPPALWRHFVISNLLATHGGLVMDGNSTLCVGPSFAPVVRDVDAAVFGITADEPMVSPGTAEAPGPSPYVGWARAPQHPAWKLAATSWNTLVVRGPQAWSAAVARRAPLDLWEAQKAAGIKTLRIPDGGRLHSGAPRVLEDLFGRVGNPGDPKMTLLPGTVYVPYDGDDLSRRYEYNWFLKLTPTEIADSDLVWARLAGV
jgi:hypothetical protein